MAVSDVSLVVVVTFDSFHQKTISRARRRCDKHLTADIATALSVTTTAFMKLMKY